jgi:hypothetical protein
VGRSPIEQMNPITEQNKMNKVKLSEVEEKKWNVFG